MRPCPLSRAAVFLMLASILIPGRAVPQNCSPIKPEASGGLTSATTIKFLDSNQALGTALASAMASWNSVCGPEDIPDLSTTGTANYTINIFSEPGTRPADPTGQD